MDRKITLGIAAGVIGFIFIALIWWGIAKLNEVKTGIEFIVVPDEITVVVNSREFRVNYESKQKFEPGEHKLEFRRDGFETKSETVLINEGEVIQVYVLLDPVTAEARDILNQAIYRPRIERISGFIVNQGAKEFEQEYPFLNNLPITDKYFSIKTCTDESGELKICAYMVINNTLQRNRAKNAATTAGIDIKKYPLNFIEKDSH